jgi:imidazole glycerol phosphate synthase subunit HisF
MIQLGRRCICCFDKTSEELVKEIQFKDITLRDLQRIFEVPATDEMIEVFDINSTHAKQLRSFLSEELDLDKYDYELHCYAISVR